MVKMISRWSGSVTRAISRMALSSLVAAVPATAQAQSVMPVPGKPNLRIGAYDVATLGYSEDEFFITGEASSFSSPAPLTSDGQWTAVPSAKANYATRMVVLRPKDAAKFNGTVVVEWLNVTAGMDVPIAWIMAHREMIRAGYAFVGVSAQKVGIEGGRSLGADMSLKKVNPARYSALAHPGDAYAYDIFSQAGRLVRKGNSNGILGPLVPKHVLAWGESQSALFLTTYLNAIDPLAKVYDGFLIHSRFGGSAPLDGSSIMAQSPTPMPPIVKFRSDLRVPVMTFITETDAVGIGRMGFSLARQPDSARLRVWEVPGTAHADAYSAQVAPIDTGLVPAAQLAEGYVPTNQLMGATLAKPINFAPQHHYVLQAALFGLEKWVRTGKAPAKAPPIDVAQAETPHAMLDANGLALGGIRTPWVDVPAARTSGTGNSGAALASLFGTGELFDAATLARLYPGGITEYLKRFEASLDLTIRGGFILPADRAEILQLAAAMYSGPR